MARSSRINPRNGPERNSHVAQISPAPRGRPNTWLCLGFRGGAGALASDAGVRPALALGAAAGIIGGPKGGNVLV